MNTSVFYIRHIRGLKATSGITLGHKCTGTQQYYCRRTLDLTGLLSGSFTNLATLLVELTNLATLIQLSFFFGHIKCTTRRTHLAGHWGVFFDVFAPKRVKQSTHTSEKSADTSVCALFDPSRGEHRKNTSPCPARCVRHDIHLRWPRKWKLNKSGQFCQLNKQSGQICEGTLLSIDSHKRV